MGPVENILWIIFSVLGQQMLLVLVQQAYLKQGALLPLSGHQNSAYCSLKF